MQYITSFFNAINDLGSSAILPIVIFIMGLIFRVKPGTALKSAIRVGIGVWGLSLMTTVAAEHIGPLGTALTETYGLTNTIVDGGVGVEIMVAFTYQFAGLMIPAGILLNIICLLCKFTKTLDVDVWNFWGWLFSATLVYNITGSHIWAILAFAATGMLSMKLGDLMAPRMQKAYGLEGISFPHCYATVYAIPAPLFNKLFDLIGLGKIKADPKSLQDKLGVFGDTTVIGFLIGLLLSLIAGMGVGTSISTAISFAAIILLFPTVIGFLVEGLMPISNAARTMMLKKFHSDDYYIGLDCAVGVGQPANMVVNVLAIPFIFILALVLPGVNVLPAGGIAVAAAFWCSYAMPYFDNNIVKGLLYCVIMMVPSLYAATWVAPYLTDTYIAAGGAVETGTQITCSTPYLYSDLFAWIASLFH